MTYGLSLGTKIILLKKYALNIHSEIQIFQNTSLKWSTKVYTIHSKVFKKIKLKMKNLIRMASINNVQICFAHLRFVK